MFVFRTNEKHVRKLGRSRHCLLEALLFATGAALKTINCLGFASEREPHPATVKQRLMMGSPFQLYGWLKVAGGDLCGLCVPIEPSPTAHTAH